MTESTSPKKTKAKTTALSINQRLEQLDQQIEWFYGEDFSLEQAAEKYQAAATAAKEIESDLSEIKNQIEIIDRDFSKE